MNIIILTQYYPPEHGAPQNRLHDMAKRWVTAGESVTVLAAMPNYPTGKVFDGYRGKLASSETIDGVKVIRSWIWASREKRTLPQLRAYLSFVATAILVGAVRLRKADFLICESPPLFLGGSALILSFLKRAKLVMNISDLWPESAVQLGALGPGMALRILEWFEGLLYRRSAMVSCQTEGIVDGVKKRTPSADAFLYPNGVDPDMFQPRPKDASLAKELAFPEGAFIVGYGGNHGRSQGLRQVLEAAERLRGENVFFAFFGDGPEKDELVELARKMNLDHVRFYPSQPRERMAEVIAQWDVALAPLLDLEIFHGARPSKMFELMAMRVPFIFCGRGEGADLAVESGCALSVEPEKPEQLAAAIERLRSIPAEERWNMGEKGREFVLTRFNRIALAESFRLRLRQKR